MKKIGIYLRLSKEDEQKTEESNSIQNQRALIFDYINQDIQLKNMKIIEYCDDGYSGTNMERPALQRLLKDLSQNKISCLIVKDFSRFSRNYLDLGDYLYRIFPTFNIRFIAINQKYDSVREKNIPSWNTVLEGLLVDLYSKDLSMKVKASIQRKAEHGEWIWGNVPYGYRKSGIRKNQLVVVEKEAEIVKYIFKLALEGKKNAEIAGQLNHEEIPTRYQQRKNLKNDNEIKLKKWTSEAVAAVLKNQFYIGDMVFGKTKKKDVGSKQVEVLPRKEWKIIKNHHEAIIDESIYRQLNVIDTSKQTEGKQRKQRKGRKHPFVGKITCGGCGYALVYKSSNSIKRFECYHHAVLKKDCCTYINAIFLEKLVLELFLLLCETIEEVKPIKDSFELTSEMVDFFIKRIFVYKRKVVIQWNFQK